MALTRGKEILKRLNDHHVEFVVIGGIAAILLGSARQTIDVDVCVALSAENLPRILSALCGLNPRFRMHPQRMPLPDDPEQLKMDVGGFNCRVLTIDALINAKRAANRLKDRLVLQELERIRDRAKHMDAGNAAD